MSERKPALTGDVELALANDFDGAVVSVEHRYVPVDEFGGRWVGRTWAEAIKVAQEMPPGCIYEDGAPMGGIVRIDHEVRITTDWSVIQEITT